MLRALLLGLCLGLLAAPTSAQTHFGYAGVLCGLDGPGEDFAAEVAPFTNIAHVCPTGDIATDAERLARAHALGMTPLYHVEPFFFERGYRTLTRRPTDTLWRQALLAISQSGVPNDALILYVVDEPSLVRGSLEDIFNVSRRIRADLPGVRTMVIDAYRDRYQPQIPYGIDYWGFTYYGLLDPAEDPRFMAYFSNILVRTPDSIDLVLVMDATHTPIHAEAGLTPSDMAEVAHNYAALAAETERVAIVMAYAWPSGIEWEDEVGVRDLPPQVRAAHEQIGRAITGRD